MQDNKEEMQQEQEYLTQTPSIQWFPGHMAKTRRVMKESLGLVDIVVELRDARIPKSSRNPEIEKIIGDKPRLVVFNKADIADPAVTKQWQEYYKSHGVRTLALDCRSGRGLKELVPAVREVLADLLAKRKAKGMQSRPIRMMIVGVPNVGKSSLTNALVGEKIAIVSNKPQTTRNRIYGVVNRGDTQYVLLDTPGFHKARNRLGDYMVKVTRESIADVDAVLLLVEPVAHVGIPEAELIEKIKASHLPAILCINKIDTVEKKDDLLAVIAAYSEAYAFDAIIPISARTHEGLDDLMNELGKYASEGPQLFPDGMTTDQPDRQVVGEIVREKLLRNLDKEIPHGTAVEITRFIERDDEVIEVDATIYCEKASHKGIIIGKNGAMLKKISTEARRDIERFMGTKVYLETWVKVKENWRDNMNYIRSFGYDEQ